LATENHTVALLLLPPPQWEGEENQKEKAKLVGCDINSLTEQHREKNPSNNTDQKNIQHHHPMLRLLFSNKNLFLQPAPT